MQGTTAAIICKKMNSISNAVRRNLTDGMSGMDEFSGYLSALVDVGMIDTSEQRMFNEELYRQIIGRKKVRAA